MHRQASEKVFKKGRLPRSHRSQINKSLEMDSGVAKLLTLDNRAGYYSGMIPDLGFNVAMTVIFALFFIFHVAVFVPYKQWWFGTCFIITTGMEVSGYIARVVSHSDIENRDAFLLQYVCLTIAPVFTMAGIYYQLAKLSMIYGPQNSRLKPMTYSYMFIGFDVLSILVQAAGGGIASGASANGNVHQRDVGSHIFVAGLALQVLSMTIFLGFWFDFLYSIYIRAPKRNPGVEVDSLYNPRFIALRQGRLFKYFNLLLTLAVLFIYVRCCYRVAELSEGWAGNLIRHEIYFVILDLLMISLATAILVPFYPGFVFDGRHTNVGVDGFKKSWRRDHRSASDVNSDDSDKQDSDVKPEDSDSKPEGSILA